MTTAIPAHKLPPSFTSLYRLFLRASSAAVLHHRAATRNIRTLWRPTFREAAVVIRRLQSPSLGASKREHLEGWRCQWELNMDRTLSLLITSAQSRGLAHKLMRNLSFLHFGFQEYQESTRYSAIASWDPQQRQYNPARQTRPSHIQAKEFDGQSWGALEETARMAEGKSNLTLGRMEFRLRRA